MAKVLIDLGTPGQPTTGDTLPEGGEKLNNFINDVYDAFSRKGQPPESQNLQSTGVYQIIGFSDLTLDEEYGPGYYYEAEPGEMLFIDVNEETIVYIDLPGGYSADQIKVVAAETNTPVFVRAIDSQINGQESIELTKGVQYQYIRNISAADGEWSQRIIDGSGSNTNNFDPGPIHNQFEEDFITNRPSGTPVWRYWEINLEDLASASDQSFTLFFTELGFVVHAAKIMVAWGSSFTPVEYDLRTSVVSITSGADITTGIPFVSEQKYSDNQSDYLVLDLSSAADLDTCFSGHFTMRVAVLTSFPPELFQLN